VWDNGLLSKSLWILDVITIFKSYAGYPVKESMSVESPVPANLMRWYSHLLCQLLGGDAQWLEGMVLVRRR
jgi:hypothetical protein